MKIESPVANYGDHVRVRNYRSSVSPIELGVIVGLTYSNDFGGGFSWSYRVRLDRTSRTGRLIHLHVGNDQLWRDSNCLVKPSPEEKGEEIK